MVPLGACTSERQEHCMMDIKSGRWGVGGKLGG